MSSGVEVTEALLDSRWMGMCFILRAGPVSMWAVRQLCSASSLEAGQNDYLEFKASVGCSTDQDSKDYKARLCCTKPEQTSYVCLYVCIFGMKLHGSYTWFYHRATTLNEACVVWFHL